MICDPSWANQWVRTALAGTICGHIDVELEIGTFGGHERYDGSLLAGGVEAVLVERGLEERRGLIGGPAGCASVTPSGPGDSRDDDLWGDLGTGGSRPGLWDGAGGHNTEDRDEECGNCGLGEHSSYQDTMGLNVS